jgi:hypothetical protein
VDTDRQPGSHRVLQLAGVGPSEKALSFLATYPSKDADPSPGFGGAKARNLQVIRNKVTFLFTALAHIKCLLYAVSLDDWAAGRIKFVCKEQRSRST